MWGQLPSPNNSGETYPVTAAVVGGDLRQRDNLHVHRGRIRQLDLGSTLTIEVLDDIQLQSLGVDLEHAITRILLSEDQIRTSKLERLNTHVHFLRGLELKERLHAVSIGGPGRLTSDEQVRSSTA